MNILQLHLSPAFIRIMLLLPQLLTTYSYSRYSSMNINTNYNNNTNQVTFNSNNVNLK